MSVFVQMVSYNPPNIFVTKLDIVVHHHEPECMQKKMVCYFQGQGNSKGSYDQNMTVFTVSAELLILLPGLIVHYHKPKCLREKWDCCVQGQGYSKFQNVMNVCSDIF